MMGMKSFSVSGLSSLQFNSTIGSVSYTHLDVYKRQILIYTEQFENKKLAMDREKFLKTGKGRDEIQSIIKKHLL